MIPSEHQEQAAFVSWFRAQHPGVLIFAIPNGAFLAGSVGQRAAQINKLKAEGLVKGVPDLCVPAWALFIEFKRQKGGVVSPEQAGIHEQLRAVGYAVIVARGAEDAMQQISDNWKSVGDLARKIIEGMRQK